MRNKIIKTIILLVCICIGLTLYYNATLYTNIKIGIFVGSNWEVPNPNSYTIIDKAIENFEKDHPYIRITYESGITKDDYSSWLSSLLLQGEEPDVYMVLDDDFDTLASLGALENLDELIENDNTFNIDNYYNCSLSAGKYHNSQYALPYESNPTLMFVNETLLDKENIELPDDDWTLDDFYEICKKVTKDTDNDGIIDQYGFYNYTWENAANAHNIELFNTDGTKCNFNQEDMKTVLQYIEKLNELNQQKNLSSQDFDEGNVAFYPLSFSDYRTYKPYPYKVQKYSTFKWKCISMPKVNNKEGISETSTLLLGMSSRTKHKEAAWQLLKYLSNDEDFQQLLYTYSQGIPVLKSLSQQEFIEDDSTINMNSLIQTMELNTSTSQFKKKSNAIIRANSLINEALNNNDDIDTFLNTLQKDIQLYLNE